MKGLAGVVLTPLRGQSPVRLATVTVVAFLVCLGVLAAARVVYFTGMSWQAVVGFGYLAALIGVQVRYVSPPRSELTTAGVCAVLLVQAVLVYLPSLHFPWWLGLPGILAASVLLLLPAVSAVPLFFVTVGSFTWMRAAFGDGTFVVVYSAFTTLMTGLAVYGLTRLASLVRDVDVARDELARMRVADERFRFAQDLQDLLGNRLSAIIARIDRTVDLLRTRMAQAADELRDILAVARRALADVRTVSSGYRQLSLTEELASARSVLTAAEITVRCDADDDEFAEMESTTVAAALREGVTNVLRHSAATWCEIAVRQVGDRLHLDVVNDGVAERHAAGADVAGGDGNVHVDDYGVIDQSGVGTEGASGNGLDSLARRVTAVGGEMSAGQAGDGIYRLRVTVPRSADESDALVADRGGEIVPSVSRKLATVVVAGVFGCFGGIVLTDLVVTHTTPWKIALGSTLLIMVLALQLGYIVLPGIHARPVPHIMVMLAQACLVFPPVLLFGEWWLRSFAGFFAGSLLLVFRLAVSVPLALAVLTGVAWLQTALGGGLVVVVSDVATTAATALMIYGLTRLARLVADLHAARGELARIAVAEERLRFARDVHDLLGLGLSAITLKAEVASKVLARYPDRARQQLVEMGALARKSLGDMRSVVSGYQELSLADELASARSVLASADIDVVINTVALSVPDRESVLAMVAREGVTNVLRHSKAERCEISLRDLGGQVQLEIRNDGLVTDDCAASDGGVPASDAGSADGGNGIRNLSHRVREVGGLLSYGRETDDVYRLCVRVPVTSGVPPDASSVPAARS